MRQKEKIDSFENMADNFNRFRLRIVRVEHVDDEIAPPDHINTADAVQYAERHLQMGADLVYKCLRALCQRNYCSYNNALSRSIPPDTDIQ